MSAPRIRYQHHSFMHETFMNEQLMSFEQDNKSYPFKHAVVFGKFYPLHQGHLFLLQQAMLRAQHVTVIVYHLPDQVKYPKFVRYFSVVEAMREMFPERFANGEIHIKLHDDPNTPTEPKSDNDQDYYRNWSHICRLHRSSHLPAYDLLCTSEDYGYTLAQSMGINHFCVDSERDTVPVASREIRGGRRQSYRSESFRRHQEFLDVYAETLRLKQKNMFANEHHVLLTGSESTGKTTATIELARRTGSYACLDWSREYLHLTEAHPLDFYRFFIAQAELFMETLLCHTRSFHDTSAYTTFTRFILYNEQVGYEDYPFLQGLYEEILNFLKPLEQSYSQVFVLPPNIPWEKDGTRIFKNQQLREKLYPMFENYHVSIINNDEQPLQRFLSRFDRNKKDRVILQEDLVRTDSIEKDMDTLYSIFINRHPDQFSHSWRERRYSKAFQAKYLVNHN